MAKVKAKRRRSKSVTKYATRAAVFGGCDGRFYCKVLVLPPGEGEIAFGVDFEMTAREWAVASHHPEEWWEPAVRLIKEQLRNGKAKSKAA